MLRHACVKFDVAKPIRIWAGWYWLVVDACVGAKLDACKAEDDHAQALSRLLAKMLRQQHGLANNCVDVPDVRADR